MDKPEPVRFDTSVPDILDGETIEEFLLEHYKAQMEMSKLVEHWPAYQRRE